LAAEVTDQGPRHGERLPAPHYGEYATPQDQARAIADSQPPLPPALGGPPAPDSTPSLPPARPKPRRWDLILTSVLLGYAAVNVVAQLLSGSTLTAVLTQFSRAQGIGEYTPTALAQNLGTVLNVVTVALFIVTVVVTTWMVRRGRISFWVPLVGGVAATLVALVFVVVLLQGDPAFLSYLDGLNS
jgi:hypothetical protein